MIPLAPIHHQWDLLVLFSIAWELQSPLPFQAQGMYVVFEMSPVSRRSLGSEVFYREVSDRFT